jgi:MFS transporter, MHS family, proline/betaine transporter
MSVGSASWFLPFRALLCTGIASTYLVSASIAGGFLPLVASWMVLRTGEAIA